MHKLDRKKFNAATARLEDMSATELRAVLKAIDVRSEQLRAGALDISEFFAGEQARLRMGYLLCELQEAAKWQLFYRTGLFL